MKRQSVLVLAMLILLGITNIASADMVRGIDIDFVTIGNAGNAPDSTGYGTVGYDYFIGKYEVTNAQWNAFTAAAGAPTGNNIRDVNPYDDNATYTGPQQPTNNVSWNEAVQFCNYLTSGDKSLGVYQFSGNNANPGDFLGIDRVMAEAIYGTIYFLPTEDEWYKAAYYTGSGYSLYANGTDAAPSTSETRYDIYSSPWDVGTGTEEQNGTYDMMGNVWELNETLIYGFCFGVRGGSFSGGGSISPISSLYRNSSGPEFESSHVGFRVAMTPLPSAVILGSIGLTFTGWLLKRRKML